MRKRITLPNQLDVLGIPPLALIAVAETAIAMLAAAVHCEHPNLDDLLFHDSPQKSLILANAVCDKSEDFINILAAYRRALRAETLRLNIPDLPF